MNTEYDIYEVMPDKQVSWRACARSFEDTNFLLVEFSKKSTNEFFAIHLLTNEIIRRVRHESDNGGPARTDANLP